MKREFHNIQLINRKIHWQKDSTDKSYKALSDESSIFVDFGRSHHKMLVFKNGHSFQVIDGDYIIYDELAVTEKSI